jgi:hypothetical protein
MIDLIMLPIIPITRDRGAMDACGIRTLTVMKTMIILMSLIMILLATARARVAARVDPPNYIPLHSSAPSPYSLPPLLPSPYDVNYPKIQLWICKAICAVKSIKPHRGGWFNQFKICVAEECQEPPFHP